jgi:hypothetical protein
VKRKEEIFGLIKQVPDNFEIRDKIQLFDEFGTRKELESD